MSLAEYKPNRELIWHIEHDSDLIQSITEIARNKGIRIGTFTAIGALKHARVGYYDQKDHEYRKIEIDSPHEIASCIGNISIKDGEPFIHAHAVLADEKGNTKAGHLFEGTVFAAEVHLCELEGPRLERKYDEVTGLSLWQVK
jgi:hypothetical protein